MRIKKLMKFSGLRKLRNLQGLCTPLDCTSSKTLLQERRVFWWSCQEVRELLRVVTYSGVEFLVM